MKKIISLFLVLFCLTLGNVFADEIESAQIIMEEGGIGDTVKLYLIPPECEDLGGIFIYLYFDSGVLEHIDSEFLNANGMRTWMSIDNNCITIHVEPPINKQVCIMVFFKVKTSGVPSFYLEEEYLDKEYNFITERSGYALWEKVEKNAEIPIEIEPSYSEIEIFIRDKYVLLAEEHNMSGTIWVSAYDALGNLIDIASYKPSTRITANPYSKASFVKIMWWDKRTLAPVCRAETIYFK